VSKLFVILFWSAVLFAFAMAILPHPPGLPTSDKSQHMLAFAVLASLAAIAYPRTPLTWILLGLGVFGALIEVIQGTALIHRDRDMHDWIADIVASVAVLVAVHAWRRTARAG
jgi:hypothetical protein